MNKLLLSLLCVLALFVTVAPCLADTANGVLAEERVVRLPNDQGKWYISVVGVTNEARYNELLRWFAQDVNLSKVKSQVHFCPVTTATAIYKDRYAKNVKGLPTVRMQKADGTLVYEAAGKNLPMTAAGLNGALAGAVSEAQGILPILPWRRGMENRCPSPSPSPSPTPNPMPGPTPDFDVPPIDDGGTPVIEPTPTAAGWPEWLLVPICALASLVGLGLGYGRKLREKLAPVVK